jgi:hypothetical protein
MILKGKYECYTGNPSTLFMDSSSLRELLNLHCDPELSRESKCTNSKVSKEIPWKYLEIINGIL